MGVKCHLSFPSLIRFGLALQFYCIYLFVHVLAHACGGRRTTYVCLFSPTNVWVPGMELGLLGLPITLNCELLLLLVAFWIYGGGGNIRCQNLIQLGELSGGRAGVCARLCVRGYAMRSKNFFTDECSS